MHNKQVIGIAGLIKTSINQQEYVEIAYIIDESFQGKGLTTRVVNELLTMAFSTYQLNEVIIQFATAHLASKRIAEKNGAIPFFSYNRLQGAKTLPYQVYKVDKKNFLAFSS